MALGNKKRPDARFKRGEKIGHEGFPLPCKSFLLITAANEVGWKKKRAPNDGGFLV